MAINGRVVCSMLLFEEGSGFPKGPGDSLGGEVWGFLRIGPQECAQFFSNDNGNQFSLKTTGDALRVTVTGVPKEGEDRSF